MSRLRDSRAAVAKLLAEGECRACGEGGDELERHHLLKRSQGGDDVAENIVPLCRECHDAYERGSGERWRAVAEAIGSRLQRDELGYLRQHRSYYWIEKHYLTTGAKEGAA